MCGRTPGSTESYWEVRIGYSQAVVSRWDEMVGWVPCAVWDGHPLSFQRWVASVFDPPHIFPRCPVARYAGKGCTPPTVEGPHSCQTSSREALVHLGAVAEEWEQ